MSARDRRAAVVVAGHQGDAEFAVQHIADADASVRASVLQALQRIGELGDEQIVAAFDDPAPEVRRRAAELAAKRPGIDLAGLLDDDDPTVVEIAVWACGEQEQVTDAVLMSVIGLATDAVEPLVREAAAAALGAIGDPRGLPAVLTACSDKPHVRRRAVLALAPFEGDDVDAAIARALEDRDWQVRQAAEDLRRAVRPVDPE